MKASWCRNERQEDLTGGKRVEREVEKTRKLPPKWNSTLSLFVPPSS